MMLRCWYSKHGVHRRMISVDNFFRIFEIIIFCFVVAICNLVHDVEATYDSVNSIWKSFLKYE